MDAPADALTRIEYVRGAGAETCPGDSAVHDAVADKLGYDPFTTSADARLLAAEVTGDPSGFRATIRLFAPDGSTLGARTLTHAGPSCDELVDLMVLSMSIAIDPEAAEHRRAPEPPAPPVAPPAKEPDAAPPAPPEMAERREPLHVEAGGGASTWFGAAPAPNVGASVFAGLRFRAASLALEARLDWPSSRRVSSAYVETSLALGMIVPCVHVTVLELCGLGAIGSLRATSRDVALPRADSSLHLAVGGRVGVGLPLASWLSIRAHTDGLVALTTQTLILDRAEVVTLPRFAGGMGLGVRVRFL